MKKDLLIIENLSKVFEGNKKEKFLALNNISFRLKDGECLGIVGESGCGKSTLARIIAGIEKKTTGNIFFDGNELINNKFSKNIQMIFQEPLSSFNPRMKIIDYLYEPIRNFMKIPKKESITIMKKALKDVGLDEQSLNKYPHEFSGGQLQRITIAKTLIIKPKLVICDEITSALDVSIQKQILELLEKLRIEKKLSYLFISHDLAVVQQMSQKILVMYAGKIVEILNSKDLKTNSKHSYTKKLINSVFEI